MPAGRTRDDARHAFAAKALGVLAGLATTVLTARLLTPDRRGEYVVVLTATSLLTTALSGIAPAAAQALRRGEPVVGATRSALVLATGGGLAAVGLALAAAALRGPTTAIVLLAAAIVPTAWLQTSTGLLSATGRPRDANVALLVADLLLPVLVGLLCSWQGATVADAALAWLASQLIGAGLALRRLGLGARGSSAEGLMGSAHPAALIGGIAVLSLLNYRAELLLLDAVSGAATASVYSVASTAAEVLWVVGTAAASTAMASIVRQPPEQLPATVCQAVRRVWLVSAALAVPLALLTPWVLPGVLGREYRASIAPFELLLVGTVAFAPAGILGSYFTVGRHSPRWPTATVALSAAVTIPLTLLLAPQRGASGAAVACAAGYVCGVGMLVRVFLLRTGLRAGELVPRWEDAASLLTRLRP